MSNTVNLIDEQRLADYHDELMKTHVLNGTVFDISEYNASNGTPATYANLAAALGTNGANVPVGVRRGGMSIKYIQSSDNKYVQYFLPKNTWSANEGDWEKMNLEDEIQKLTEIAPTTKVVPVETKNGFYNYNGSYNEYAGYISNLFTIEVDKNYYVSTKTAGSSLALAVFFDENDQYVGYYKRNTSGIVYNYNKELLIIPEGATKFAVTSSDVNVIPSAYNIYYEPYDSSNILDVDKGQPVSETLRNLGYKEEQILGVFDIPSQKFGRPSILLQGINLKKGEYKVHIDFESQIAHGWNISFKKEDGTNIASFDISDSVSTYDGILNVSVDVDSAYLRVYAGDSDIAAQIKITFYSLLDSTKINYPTEDISVKDALDKLSAETHKKVSEQDLNINLYNSADFVEGKYIGFNGSRNTYGPILTLAGSAMSPMIKIEGGKVYHFHRPRLSADTVCCFVAEDGTLLHALNYSDNTELTVLQTRGSIYEELTLKAPLNAKYFIFSIAYSGFNSGDELGYQVEFGSKFTGYKEYDEKAIGVGYSELPSDVSGCRIDISSSDKIGIFSTSFMNGYCMKTHHAINNLSMFTDFIFYNFGKSGDDPLATLTRIENNEKWLGDVPVQDWGIKYGISIFQENDAMIYNTNPEAYFAVFDKLCNAIKAMGGIPMVSTEHDWSKSNSVDKRNLAYYTMQRLCNTRGYVFMDWMRTATALFNEFFEPFWESHHPATRTHWLWTNGILPYVKALPRPLKSIKIFRVRPDYVSENNNALLYNNNLERAERFLEINQGVSALTDATEKYFDRLNSGLSAYENVKDEYQMLQSHSQSINLNNRALIECVLPYEQNNIISVVMNLVATGVTSIFIKKNISITNGIITNTRYIGFGVASGVGNLTVGQQFTVTGGTYSSTLWGTYTITEISNNGNGGGSIITSTEYAGKVVSGTDNPITDLVDVVLRGSFRKPSNDFFANIVNPFAEWVQMPISADGNYDLGAYLPICVDYDKIAILLVGSNISLSNVCFDVRGKEIKNRVYGERVERKNGTSVLTDTLLDDNTAWDDINSIPKYTPVIDPINNTPEALPIGVTTVRKLDEGESLTQAIIKSGLNQDAYATSKLQCRIVARYFPEYVDSDSLWESSDIKQGSYDCARIIVGFDDFAFTSIEVGAYWGEYIVNTDYMQGDKLFIKAMNKRIQIAKVELEKVN